jgi:hypothetical protein
MAKAFTFETQFDGMKMTHVINDKVRVETDLGTLESRRFVRGKEVKKISCSGMTLSAYENYLKSQKGA